MTFGFVLQAVRHRVAPATLAHRARCSACGAHLRWARESRILAHARCEDCTLAVLFNRNTHRRRPTCFS